MESERGIVLFDANGTLFADSLIVHQCSNAVFLSCGKIPITPFTYYRLLEEYQGNVMRIYEEYGIPLSPEKIREIYRQEYAGYVARGEIPLAKNVLAALEKLQEAKISLGVITSQKEDLFFPVAEKFHLDKFFGTHIYTGISDKSGLIMSLLKTSRISPKNCFYVGDAPSDVTHAKKAGVWSVAYLNGFVPYELILESRPNFLLDDFSWLFPIVQTFLSPRSKKQ